MDAAFLLKKRADDAALGCKHDRGATLRTCHAMFSTKRIYRVRTRS